MMERLGKPAAETAEDWKLVVLSHLETWAWTSSYNCWRKIDTTLGKEQREQASGNADRAFSHMGCLEYLLNEAGISYREYGQIRDAAQEAGRKRAQQERAERLQKSREAHGPIALTN